jgi:hypothetical protein
MALVIKAADLIGKPSTAGVATEEKRGPGNRKSPDDLSPGFAVVVEGEELQGDVTQYITLLEYEYDIDLADVGRIVVANPGFMWSEGVAGNANLPPVTSDAGPMPETPLPLDMLSFKAFQPGNSIDFYMGYGFAETFMGRGVIAKHLPIFPQSGMPTLDLRAYDKRFYMMDVQGPIAGSGTNKIRFAKTLRTTANPESMLPPTINPCRKLESLTADLLNPRSLGRSRKSGGWKPT